MEAKLFTPDQIGSRPLWFLDVDGIINCFPAPRHEQLMQSQDWRDATVKGYKIWWRASVVDFINRMSREGLAQIVWLTTWTTDAAEVLAPVLGISDFAVIGNDSGGDWPDLSWWKWKRVEEIVEASEQHFVWTDDDISMPVRAETERKFFMPHLLVAPHSNPALEDAHLHQIEEFLTTLKAEAHD